VRVAVFNVSLQEACDRGNYSDRPRRPPATVRRPGLRTEAAGSRAAAEQVISEEKDRNCGSPGRKFNIPLLWGGGLLVSKNFQTKLADRLFY